jgi:hypothetical protein
MVRQLIYMVERQLKLILCHYGRLGNMYARSMYLPDSNRVYEEVEGTRLIFVSMEGKSVRRPGSGG